MWWLRRRHSLLSESECKGLAPRLEPDVTLVSVTKGIEKTAMRMSGVQAETGKMVAVLSGPSHAEKSAEDSYGLCGNIGIGRQPSWSGYLYERVFSRLYHQPRRRGVELGAAMKNVIACAPVSATGWAMVKYKGG